MKLSQKLALGVLLVILLFKVVIAFSQDRQEYRITDTRSASTNNLNPNLTDLPDVFLYNPVALRFARQQYQKGKAPYVE